MKQQLLPSGILHLTDAAEMPKTLAVAGREYTHLMCGIYLPCPTHELNLAQLQDVNRLRDSHFQKDDSSEQKNDSLKKLVAQAFEDCAGGKDLSVVDIGSGTTTIAPYFNKLARYVGVDIDPEVVSALKNKGVESCERKDMPALKTDGKGMNAFLALYVLHFNIDSKFFGDIAKLMHNDDVMFANLYRVSDERKQELRAQAEKAGLYIAPEVADTKLSPGRQVFWAVAKRKQPAEKLAHKVQKGLAVL